MWTTVLKGSGDRDERQGKTPANQMVHEKINRRMRDNNKEGEQTEGRHTLTSWVAGQLAAIAAVLLETNAHVAGLAPEAHDVTLGHRNRTDKSVGRRRDVPAVARVGSGPGRRACLRPCVLL